MTASVEGAVELLRSEIEGYRVAAEIERGVMWSLAPYVDEFRSLGRADTPSTPLLTRLVREASSSRSNEERMERLAKATETLLADHAALTAYKVATDAILERAALDEGLSRAMIKNRDARIAALEGALDRALALLERWDLTRSEASGPGTVEDQTRAFIRQSREETGDRT